jgi:hypothetical protein
VSRLDPEIARAGPFQDRVSDRAVDEDDRPFAARHDLLHERLDEDRLANRAGLQSRDDARHVAVLDQHRVVGRRGDDRLHDRRCPLP